MHKTFYINSWRGDGDRQGGILRANMDSKSGSSLASAAFVQTHNAIGSGLLLFPYTFWAFGGILETVAAQLVSYTLHHTCIISI